LGVVIDLRADGPIDYLVLKDMEQLPFVLGQIKRVDSNEVRILVDTAETALPALIDCAAARTFRSNPFRRTSPFDDVL
jgi:hypothetical protein